MRRGEFTFARSQRGFTYVWALAAVAVLGVGLAAVGPAWHDTIKREREKDALRIGHLYATAIASYYKSSPGSAKVYPPTLESLLLDARFVGTYRHLRRLYGDPLQAGGAWGLVRAPDGGIRGVFSRSNDEPFRQEALDMGVTVLVPAKKYSEWMFVPKVD